MSAERYSWIERARRCESASGVCGAVSVKLLVAKVENGSFEGLERTRASRKAPVKGLLRASLNILEDCRESHELQSGKVFKCSSFGQASETPQCKGVP